jgi:hypothetical protein
VITVTEHNAQQGLAHFRGGPIPAYFSLLERNHRRLISRVESQHGRAELTFEVLPFLGRELEFAIADDDGAGHSWFAVDRHDRNGSGRQLEVAKFDCQRGKFADLGGIDAIGVRRQRVGVCGGHGGCVGRRGCRDRKQQRLARWSSGESDSPPCGETRESGQ